MERGNGAGGSKGTFTKRKGCSTKERLGGPEILTMCSLEMLYENHSSHGFHQSSHELHEFSLPFYKFAGNKGVEPGWQRLAGCSSASRGGRDAVCGWEGWLDALPCRAVCETWRIEGACVPFFLGGDWGRGGMVVARFFLFFFFVGSLGWLVARVTGMSSRYPHVFWIAQWWIPQRDACEMGFRNHQLGRTVQRPWPSLLTEVLTLNVLFELYGDVETHLQVGSQPSDGMGAWLGHATKSKVKKLFGSWITAGDLDLSKTGSNLFDSTWGFFKLVILHPPGMWWRENHQNSQFLAGP